jgi:DNA-binding NarL/FixJ family response regulator
MRKSSDAKILLFDTNAEEAMELTERQTKVKLARLGLSDEQIYISH